MIKLSIYILYSQSRDLFYIGKSLNINKRLKQHNRGESGFTKTGVPWQLVWIKTFKNIKEAESLERKLKNLSRARKVKFMLKYKEGIVSLANFEELLKVMIK